MGLDMSVPIEQTIALEKINPVTDSALPNSFGGGLTMLELVNKLLRVVNSAVANDIAMSNNFTNLLAAFETLRGYVAENGFGDGSITSDMIAPLAVGFTHLAKGSVKGDKIAAQSIESYHINNRVIGAAHIMDGNVVNEKIADGHVTTEKLADGAVTTDKIASLAVGFNELAKGSVKGDRIATQSIESYHLNNRVIGASHIMDGNVVNEKIANGHVSTEKLANGAVTKAKLDSELLNSIYRTPLVLYGMLDNENPEMYLNDPTYGDAALEAILAGRPILVRTPNADMLGMTNAQLVSIHQYTAIFSPVLTYQLPNYENDYLYLFYLRDEKQTIPLSGVGNGGIQIPVYGQLKLRLSTKYNQCPLEPMTTREYANLLLGLTQS